MVDDSSDLVQWVSMSLTESQRRGVGEREQSCNGVG
jgi:hypothetical protein